MMSLYFDKKPTEKILTKNMSIEKKLTKIAAISSWVGALFILSFGPSLQAQILIEDGSKKPEVIGTIDQSEAAPKKKVGEGAAREYFTERKNSESNNSDHESGAEGVRYMAIQLGSFMSDTQHRWGGARRADDVGELTLGVTYRVGEWVNSMDLLARIEYQMYEIDNQTTKKLSLLPMITFPDVRSGFPLYFGAGAGLGLFLDQVPDESDLSLDYQIIAGLRLMDMFENGGVILETGLKGHFHLIGSGQFSGTFLSVGGAFTF